MPHALRACGLTDKEDVVVKEIDLTLLRLAILRVNNREQTDRGRPKRKYIPGDGKIIVQIVIKVREAYSAAINQMRKEGLSGSPDFKEIRDTILNRESAKYYWLPETRNLYASVISTYFSLTHHTKPDDAIISRRELSAFEQLFMGKY